MHEPLSGEVEISRRILEANDESARRNAGMLKKHRVFAVNLMGSPGGGKTSLLEKTIPALSEMRIAVIEGDIEGEQDRDRVKAAGAAAAEQINTYGACHLLAHQVEHELEHLDINGLDLLFIENIGNLVCPAEFDLGEAAKVMVLGVTEGADKPLKYPLMFRRCAGLVLNKMDLAGVCGCDVSVLKANVLKVNPGLELFEMSCRTGEGLGRWTGWLRAKVKETRGK